MIKQWRTMRLGWSTIWCIFLKFIEYSGLEISEHVYLRLQHNFINNYWCICLFFFLFLRERYVVFSESLVYRVQYFLFFSLNYLQNTCNIAEYCDWTIKKIYETLFLWLYSLYVCDSLILSCKICEKEVCKYYLTNV